MHIKEAVWLIIEAAPDTQDLARAMLKLKFDNKTDRDQFIDSKTSLFNEFCFNLNLTLEPHPQNASLAIVRLPFDTDNKSIDSGAKKLVINYLRNECSNLYTHNFMTLDLERQCPNHATSNLRHSVIYKGMPDSVAPNASSTSSGSSSPSPSVSASVLDAASEMFPPPSSPILSSQRSVTSSLDFQAKNSHKFSWQRWLLLHKEMFNAMRYPRFTPIIIGAGIACAMYLSPYSLLTAAFCSFMAMSLSRAALVKAKPAAAHKKDLLYPAQHAYLDGKKANQNFLSYFHQFTKLHNYQYYSAFRAGVEADLNRAMRKHYRLS